MGVLGCRLLRPGTLGIDIPGMSWKVPDCSLGLLRPGTSGMSGKGRPGMSCGLQPGTT